MIGKLRTRLFYTILLVCLAFWSFNALNAFADIIVDNGDSGTFYTGTWKVSGGSNPYGVDSLWARDGATYTWQFDSQASGTYEVLMWWSEWPSRGTDISVDINYRGGIETRSINQLENAGLWNSFGTYYFDVSGSVTITAANGSTVSTCADAVWFKLISANTPPTASIDSITPNPAEPGQPVQFIGQGTDAEGSVEAYQWESSIDGSLSDLSSFTTSSLTEGTHTISFKVQDDEGIWSEAVTQDLVVGAIPTEIIIDNRDAETSQTGTWGVSGGPDPYGADSVWSRDGATFTWHFTPPQSGDYEVSIWWTEWPSRSTSVPVDIEHSGGTTTVYINQRQNGGQWNNLGEYSFESGLSYNVTITAQPGPSSTCADAVKFNFLNAPPTAIIDSIIPNPANVGEDVTFSGHGEDTDGTVVVYSWDSNIDGHLSDEASFSWVAVSEGEHIITFIVQDNEGEWSPPATETLVVGNIPPEAFIDSITSNPANVGEDVTFSGHGEDSDGSITSYSWTSNIDGILSNETSFSRDSLSEGEHVITFTVYDNEGAASEPVSQTLTIQGEVTEVFIDNGGPATSSTGTWSISGGSNPHGSDSLWSRDGATYTWTFSPTVSGYYEVSMWWTEWPSRSTNVPVDIEYSDGTARVYINQRQNGGQWNRLGDYFFESGSNYRVIITAQPGPSSTCADAVRFVKVPDPEHIYACLVYNHENSEPDLIRTLRDIGAYQEGDVWKYKNESQKKTYIIQIIRNIEGMTEALKTEGAHLIIAGHANYGLGAVFATPDEIANQVIDDIRYIDDDRILNYSSPWIHLNIRGIRTSQAYPYWWPIFKDGTSGIMPYDFGDPRGDPPYNYYITYQVPGDSTYYKVETVHNGAIERFSDSGRPAWYSPDGTAPVPTSPEHLQYYITNPEPWYPSFEYVGDWIQSQVVAGYFKENYFYTPAGQGDDEVRWIFRIPEPANYKVFAWWSASQAMTPNAPYTVNHASGSTTVVKDQRVNGGQWNEIGEFYFDAQEYSVILTDDADVGNVVADAVRVAHVDNPPDIVQADFYARTRNGTAPLEVRFANQGTGDLTDRVWDFGDGSTNNTRDYVTHTYTAPGTYTVRLTVSGPLGSDTKTKVDYITVGDTTPALQSEFSSFSRIGTVPLEVSFQDRSSGNIISWFWDFGDGETSDEQNPIHTYSMPGNYTVRLTVTDTYGDSVTETKENFVLVAIFDESIDNVDYPKTHFRNKTILFRKELEIPKEELKYSRLFYESCNAGNYYLDTFDRGIVFYTLNVSDCRGIYPYLKAYLEGKSNEQLWEILQNHQPLYDYYDFNKLPSEQ